MFRTEKERLIRHMDKLGYAESTIGTQYIRDAVEVAHGLERRMMCKDIYPAVAKKNNTTLERVERAMRTATDKAMRSPSWDYHWKTLGGWGHPTNAEVVMRLLRESRDEN